MAKVRCYCGNAEVNEKTAFASVAGHVCCSTRCYNSAKESQMREIEPLGVSGGVSGSSPAESRWDVV